MTHQVCRQSRLPERPSPRISRRQFLVLPAFSASMAFPADGADVEVVREAATLLESCVPAEHPRMLVRRTELDEFTLYMRSALAARGTPSAFGVLSAVPHQAGPPLRPAHPMGRDAARIAAWRIAWQTASGASTTAQLLALRYLALREPHDLVQATRWLHTLCAWSLNTVEDYRSNTEAYVQSLQPLLFAYDWLHEWLPSDQRTVIAAELGRRLDTLFVAIRARISLHSPQRPAEGLSHPMRFVATLGHGALALWGEHARAAEQLAWAWAWYRHRFPIWGGDDGGWSEGIEYHSSGLSHHLRLLEDLAALGAGAPLQRPFWRNTGYFLANFLPPYPSSSFSDLPTPPRPNASRRLLLDKLGHLNGDGTLLRLAQRFGSWSTTGLSYYQFNAIDAIFHSWRLPSLTTAPAASLDQMPRSRHFRDIGWVAMHSHWDDVGDTIMFGFKSSPVGSVSHGFADQNAFVINAYRHALAVSTGVRDWYGSPHYEQWTRAAKSKNVILVNGQGPGSRDPGATGHIMRFVAMPRGDFTTGDASAAYRTMLRRALRHVFFVDRRYFVMLDELDGTRAASHQWLLHSRASMVIDAAGAHIDVDHGTAGLRVNLLAPEPHEIEFVQSDRHDPPPEVDTAALPREWHLTVSCRERVASRRFLAVLRPWKGRAPAANVSRRPTSVGHAITVGEDLVLMAEEASRLVRTDGAELTGLAAFITPGCVTVVEVTRLHARETSLDADRPLSAQLELGTAAWQLTVQPHGALVVHIGIDTAPREVLGPSAMHWAHEAAPSRIRLELPASAQSTVVTLRW